MRDEDLERVLAIEQESFPVPWTRETFSNELRIPFSQSIVAFPEGRPGEVAGYRVRWLVADEVHLLDVAVAPWARRRGLGARLVASLLEEASSHGARLVTLEVRASNAAAQALYRKLGFATVRRRKGYYAEGEDALVMEWHSPCCDVS